MLNLDAPFSQVHVSVMLLLSLFWGNSELRGCGCKLEQTYEHTLARTHTHTHARARERKHTCTGFHYLVTLYSFFKKGR
jgi:hypothetical protein